MKIENTIFEEAFDTPIKLRVWFPPASPNGNNDVKAKTGPIVKSALWIVGYPGTVY